jgi:hypothetical protein
MKALILVIILLLVAGCSSTVVEENNDSLFPPDNQAEDNSETIPQNEEVVEEVEESVETENVVQINLKVNVLDGSFEEDVENFVALDNPLKVGFQYSKYYLSAYDGEGTMRVIISQAKKDALETPAFKVNLLGFVETGKKYRVTMYLDDIKGSWYPMKIGFGNELFSEYISESVSNEYTKVVFDVTADATSEYLYLYFDGRNAKTFKIDSISISEN